MAPGVDHAAHAHRFERLDPVGATRRLVLSNRGDGDLVDAVNQHGVGSL